MVAPNTSELFPQPTLTARLLRDARIAAAFLTILPIAGEAASSTPTPPADPDQDELDFDFEFDVTPPDVAAAPAVGWLAPATGFFPIIGAFVGGGAGLVLLGAFHIGLHPLACALLATLALIAISGALHEDGLADCADALGARKDEDRLAILRDSRLGAFGALALVFSVLLRASLLSGLFSPETAALALVAAAAMSRAMLPALMRWLPAVRPDGLAATAGTPEPAHVAVALLLALVIGWGALGAFVCMLALAVAAAAAFSVAALAQRTLGGKTGDVLGAAQVVAEIAALAAIAASQ